MSHARTYRSHLLAASALSLLLLGSLASPGLAQAPSVVAPGASPGAASPGETEGGAIALPELNVQATAWRAWEHVPGYVAPVTTTGTKTDTPLIEAPQSVSVVTREQMDEQAALSVSGALRYSAGVLSEVRPSARYDSVFVRGFGGQGTGAAFVNFLDGLRQGRGLYFGVPNNDPWLLERIEVLRGPASVLYGQTGAGGIVNMVSRRPSAISSNELWLAAGSHGLWQAAFDSTGALNDDKTLLYRMTGLARTSGTQYDYTDEQRFAIAPAFTWRPDADTTLTVLTSYQRDPEGGYYNFVPANGSALYNPNGRITRNFFGGDPSYDAFRRTHVAAGYQFEKRLNDTWTVRQNFRYAHIDAEVNVVSIRSVLNNRTGVRGATFVSDHANTYALDNQAQATFDTGPLHHTMLFGVDWQRTSSRARQGTGTAPSIDLFRPAYYQRIPTIYTTLAGLTNQNLDQIGFYTQDQIALDRWRFNIGVRYDRASIGTTSHDVAGGDSAISSQVDYRLTWRAGGLYLFDNGLAPYVSYSNSFLPNTGVSAPQRGSTPFAPSTGEQYEIGLKYQPPGINSFIQVAAYHITQRNVLTQDPIYTTYSVPQGEIRSRGIEVEGRASLNDNLDLIGAYSYIDAEITESTTPGVSGNRVPQVPNHLASGWGYYSFHDGPLRGLSLGGGIRYVGPTYGNDLNTFKVPAATLFDAVTAYDLGARFDRLRGIELSVNAQNLADKDYIASLLLPQRLLLRDRAHDPRLAARPHLNEARGNKACPAMDPPVALARSAWWEMPAGSAPARTHRILLGWPEAAPPSSGYAVLLLLDGGACFATALEAYRALAARPGGAPPHAPLLILGLAPSGGAGFDHAARLRDYTPAAPGAPEGSGGANAFLDLVEQGVLPELARRFPLDRSRIALFGHSFGGLLAVHALLARPGLFRCLLAASPSLWWAAGMTLDAARRFAAAPPDAAGRSSLLVTVGTLEEGGEASDPRAGLRAARHMRGNAASLAAILAPCLGRTEHAELPGEDHGSARLVGLSRGLRFLLSDPALAA